MIEGGLVAARLAAQKAGDSVEGLVKFTHQVCAPNRVSELALSCLPSAPPASQLLQHPQAAPLPAGRTAPRLAVLGG